MSENRGRDGAAGLRCQAELWHRRTQGGIGALVGEYVPLLAAAQASACKPIIFETRTCGALNSRHEAEVCPHTGPSPAPQARPSRHP